MKTLNEIVAEMRNITKPGETMKHTYELLHNFAHDIEAAHKRELEDAMAATVVAAAKSSSEVYEPHIQSEPIGNAAKMREVVAETEKRIDKCISILTEIPDSCGYGGLLEDAADELCELKEQFIKPALSAPARNCDLYKSEPEAYQAYLTAMKNATKKTYVYFEPWLFAEAKGDKK